MRKATKYEQKSILKDSQTDWDRIDKMKDDDIDLSEIPEITQDQFFNAKLRIAGKPVQSSRFRVMCNVLLISQKIKTLLES